MDGTVLEEEADLVANEGPFVPGFVKENFNVQCPAPVRRIINW